MMGNPHVDAIMGTQPPTPRLVRSGENPTVPGAHLGELVETDASGQLIPKANTPPLDSGPSVEAPAEVQSGVEADGPSAVQAHERDLTLRWTALKENLPILEVRAAKAMSDLRLAKKEMADIVRILKVHERMRNPRRRKQ